ncbi:MAG TPA: class I SAM-dependent methyltransferase [Candidatus Limnocylindria bacterium]|nr:class I SAM-dependent methyltransferase [Candidatus Limnocylindria bacterium]
MGAGDGHASLRAARKDPTLLAIAMDPSSDRLRDASRAAARQSIANGLFVVAAIEQLPTELTGRADEVTINFPWGTLLTGLVKGETSVLAPLARLAKAGAPVRMLLSVGERDRSTGLPPLDPDTLEARAPAYARAGFDVAECRAATADEVAGSNSSWARRLGRRPVCALVLRRRVERCDATATDRSVVPLG